MAMTNRTAVGVPFTLNENDESISRLALERLNDLAKLVGDAKRGIETVRENNDIPVLDALFNKLIDMHEKHFLTISNILAQHKMEPQGSSTAAGALHRTWLNLKASITDNDGDSILDGVYFGERHLYSRYDDVMSEFVFPQTWEDERDKLATQLQELGDALNQIRDANEAFKNHN